MGESPSHKRIKRREAGKSGRVEVPIGNNQRLDVRTRRRAKEIERSPSLSRLRLAAERLKRSRASQKILVVPQPNMAVAARAMREVGVKGSVKNLSGTKRVSVTK